MKRILSIFIAFLLLITLVSCKKDNILSTPSNVKVSDTGLITWDEVENATSYVVTINGTPNTVSVNSFQVVDITNNFECYIVACAKGYITSAKSETVKFTPKDVDKPRPPVVLSEIKIGISGPSEVKSEKSITLKAVVSGTNNKEVVWEIANGSEYASINDKGVLTAKKVDGDKIIDVVCKSAVNNEIYATKQVTIIERHVLTQEMLDKISSEKISFVGFVNINLYTIGLFEKLESTYKTTIKTSMDGTNWYSEYENGNTGTIDSLYYKNHNDLACQIGVSLMNEEEYFPMLDEYGREISWYDAGLYNSLKGLSVYDFTFNEDTWRYEYTGYNKDLDDKIVASANPYDFIPIGFSLIIDQNEVIGIYSKSEYDYNISQNYKAIQELNVVFSCNDDVVVPSISKYSHEDIHDDLKVAIDNMQKLNNYTLEFKEITSSNLYGGVVQSGFTEYVTDNSCYYKPFDVYYDMNNDEIHEYEEFNDYGYHKINDNLYNSFHQLTDGSYRASRAFSGDFDTAKPTFGFAPEIFRYYYIDEEEGTIRYEVDDLMSYVATAYYYGVGNDINLYGIFATRGYTSSTESFTPYIVVKDGYIIEAGFYFYVGSIYGVVELKYSNFNETTLPEDVTIEFETREIPTSWDQLFIEVSTDSESTTEDRTVNALEYLKEFYNDEEIGDKMPFFGVPLGDTYGFGLTIKHMPGGTSNFQDAIVFYYDVPLGIDYTIDEPLKNVALYLESLGFVKNEYNEYIKGDICIAPLDKELDLQIYVWKK